MQVALTPSSAAEVRLLAAFMQDLADLMDTTPPVDNAHVAAGCAPFVPVAEGNATAPKRTRGKKETSATTAETPAASGSSETVAPAEGNAPAPAATEPAASAEAPAGSTTTASEDGPAASPAEEAVTHDSLRVLFGELTQRGAEVKAAIIAAMKSKGFGSIKEIPADALADAKAVMLKAAE